MRLFRLPHSMAHGKEIMDTTTGAEQQRLLNDLFRAYDGDYPVCLEMEFTVMRRNDTR